MKSSSVERESYSRLLLRSPNDWRGGGAWNIFFVSIYVGISTHVWFLPHLFGKTHFYTESSYVAFTTLVCFIAHMCGNNQICVRKPHREVLGFFHTCLVKHTHVLISPWDRGGLHPWISLINMHFPHLLILCIFEMYLFNHFAQRS